MPIQKSDVSSILNEMADLLEIQGANQFRVRAYRNAARAIGNQTLNLSDLVDSPNKLRDIPGIGENIAEKIQEICKTGSLKQLDKLKKEVDPEMSDLLNLEGLGPKKVKALVDHLGVTNLHSLKEAAGQHKIRELSGFGAKTEEHILSEIKQYQGKEKRIHLMKAEQRAEPLVNYLKTAKGVRQITIAGSFRRRKETVGDLDIVATCKKDTEIMDRFTAYDDVQKVVSKGKTRAAVVLRGGLHVDLRVLQQVSYGAALHYLTGSKAHNIAVRKRAVKKGLKINEYGVFKGKKRIAGKNEKEVYKAVGLPYIQPELRENRGELEAAEENRLPDLIIQNDLRGDLHVHTNATDGYASLKEMAEAARDQGYEYLGITDHSKKVTMAHGLNRKRLAQQIKEIDRLNKQLNGIVLLKGVEVDILENGELDLPNEILKELDFTVCSVHYHRKLSSRKMTDRIIRAMDNPYFSILGHPTGRMINKREPYEIDLEKIMEAAVERNCFLEVNSDPERLDLADHYCMIARGLGLKLSLSTDAHSTDGLKKISWGVEQARRGWLEADDVINTRSLKKLKKLLNRT